MKLIKQVGKVSKVEALVSFGILTICGALFQNNILNAPELQPFYIPTLALTIASAIATALCAIAMTRNAVLRRKYK